MKKKLLRQWRKVTVPLLVLVAVVCIVVIIQSLISEAENKAKQEELKQIFESSSQQPGETDETNLQGKDGQPYINSKFTQLLEINKELIGWLEIGNLSVPVVQSDNNEYYLKHDFYNKDDPHGTVFLDARNQLEPNDDNLILYGHNYNKTQNMFYVVEQYKKAEFANETPVFTFSTLHETAEYAVFAVFLANTEPSQGTVFDYHNQLRFTTTAGMNQFLADVKARSLISTSVAVDFSDQLLTLSTCGYDFSGERIVLMARRLRDDEKREDFQKKDIVKNYNAIMPEAWTRLYGSGAVVQQ